MLIEKTISQIIRGSIDQILIMEKMRHEISKFQDLCRVLRSQGSSFIEEIDPSKDEIIFHLSPVRHGDYLDIVEALDGMGFHRSATGEFCEIVNPQCEAPVFWLHIPEVTA